MLREFRCFVEGSLVLYAAVHNSAYTEQQWRHEKAEPPTNNRRSARLYSVELLNVGTLSTGRDLMPRTPAVSNAKYPGGASVSWSWCWLPFATLVWTFANPPLSSPSRPASLLKDRISDPRCTPKGEDHYCCTIFPPKNPDWPRRKKRRGGGCTRVRSSCRREVGSLEASDVKTSKAFNKHSLISPTTEQQSE